MNQRLRLAAALSLLTLTACGQEDVAEPTAPSGDIAPAAPAGPPRVDVGLTLGTFDGAVTDLAAVEADALGFQGRILAANGLAGVQMIQVDGTFLGTLAPVLRAENLEATLLAVSYAFGPEGRVLQFVPEPGGVNRIELKRPEAPQEAPERTWSVDERLVDLCVSGEQGIVVTDTGRVGRFEVSPSAGLESAVRLMDDIGGARRCFETPSALLVAAGARMIDVTGADPVAVDIDPAAAGVAETAGGLVPIMVEAGALSIGGISVQVRDGNDLVVLPETIEVTGGNFGGILRDGMVAVLSEDNQLHLVAWSGLANAAGQPRRALSMRRDEAGEASALSLEEDLEALRPQRELPGFEEPELPEPPTGPGR